MLYLSLSPLRDFSADCLLPIPRGGHGRGPGMTGAVPSRCWASSSRCSFNWDSKLSGNSQESYKVAVSDSRLPVRLILPCRASFTVTLITSWLIVFGPHLFSSYNLFIVSVTGLVHFRGLVWNFQDSGTRIRAHRAFLQVVCGDTLGL